MSLAPEFQIGAVELFERDVVYRMPFRSAPPRYMAARRRSRG